MENTGRYRQSFWMKLKTRTYITWLIAACSVIMLSPKWPIAKVTDNHYTERLLHVCDLYWYQYSRRQLFNVINTDHGTGFLLDWIDVPSKLAGKLIRRPTHFILVYALPCVRTTSSSCLRSINITLFEALVSSKLYFCNLIIVGFCMDCWYKQNVNHKGVVVIYITG